MVKVLGIFLVVLLLIIVTSVYFIYNSSFVYCKFIKSPSELKLGDSVTTDPEACTQFMQYCKKQATTTECKKAYEQAELLAKLENPPNKEFCQEQDSKEFTYHCLKNDAVFSGAKSSCSAKEVCFLNLAINEKEISYCSEFRDVDSCKYEFAVEIGDESSCSQFSGDTKENCYYLIATIFKKPKLCLSLIKNYTDIDSKNNCLSDAISITEDELFLRPDIKEPEINSEDIFICTDYLCKDYTIINPFCPCYFIFSKKFGVDNTCNKLSEDDNIICYRSYTKLSGDKSYCNLIKELTKPQTPPDRSIPPAPPDIIECRM